MGDSTGRAANMKVTKCVSTAVQTDTTDFFADIGSDASVRLLKAKVKVLQEDSSKLLDYNHELIAENASLDSKLKELQQNESSVQKLMTAQQLQLDQTKQKCEDGKVQVANLEVQCATLQKELDLLKKTQKQSSSSQSSLEIRLNRALNQVTAYKEQLQRMQQSSKDISVEERKKIEELELENKRLLKQKNELLLGFKKQMRLIDILKRQKLHLEAARMLQFSEEEFMKIVDWKE